MQNLLILGGTGFLGRALIAKLVQRSGGTWGPLVVPTRRIMRGRSVQLLPSVQVVEADVHDESRLVALLRGRDAVVNLIAILHGDEAAFRQAHVELPRKLARACRASGVRRLVHVSALGAGGDAPSMYQRSKAAGEAVLQQSTLDVTLLRPSVMFGEGDHFLNLFAKLQTLLPVLPLAGAHARFQPVWVEDVAEAIARCLERPEAIGETYECTGPEVFTLLELVRKAGAWSGHSRPVIPLPDALARMQARSMEWLPGEPLMSRDNLDSMRMPNVASGSLPGLGALGIEPAALEAVAPLYLKLSTSGQGRLNLFRATPRR